jgi:hypothetical protein
MKKKTALFPNSEPNRSSSLDSFGAKNQESDEHDEKIDELSSIGAHFEG